MATIKRALLWGFGIAVAIMVAVVIEAIIGGGHRGHIPMGLF